MQSLFSILIITPLLDSTHLISLVIADIGKKQYVAVSGVSSQNPIERPRERLSVVLLSCGRGIDSVSQCLI